MYVGILGGTGPAGQALAARLASVGCEVVIGSRRWNGRRRPATSFGRVVRPRPGPEAGHQRRGGPGRPGRGGHRVGGVSRDGGVGRRRPAGQGRRLHGQRPGQDRRGAPTGGPADRLGGRGGAGGRPAALVATAFNHIPARDLGRLDRPLEGDVVVCADHPAAADATIDLVGRYPASAPSAPARWPWPAPSKGSPRC